MWKTPVWIADVSSYKAVPQMVEDSQFIRLSGKRFEMVFSKASGLIVRATYKGHTVLQGGPVLNLAPARLRGWWLSHLKTATTDDEAVIEVPGNYEREGDFLMRPWFMSTSR
jgi:hypothetical protein